jgi:hypothetical protein
MDAEGYRQNLGHALFGKYSTKVRIIALIRFSRLAGSEHYA